MSLHGTTLSEQWPGPEAASQDFTAATLAAWQTPVYYWWLWVGCVLTASSLVCFCLCPVMLGDLRIGRQTGLGVSTPL